MNEDRRGKPWTVDEERKMLQMWREGKSVEEIAAALGRGVRGTAIRLEHCCEGEMRRALSRSAINAAWRRMKPDLKDE